MPARVLTAEELIPPREEDVRRPAQGVGDQGRYFLPRRKSCRLSC